MTFVTERGRKEVEALTRSNQDDSTRREDQINQLEEEVRRMGREGEGLERERREWKTRYERANHNLKRAKKLIGRGMMIQTPVKQPLRDRNEMVEEIMKEEDED